MRRFYRAAAATRDDDGFIVALDGRPVRTPAKNLLTLPTESLAEAVAAEWHRQGEEVDPHSMRLTRLANSAIDRVAKRRREVIDEIVAYVETDLVCYRAEKPEELVRRQTAAWQPLVEWIGRDHGIVLEVTDAILPAPQPAESAEKVARLIASHGDMSLAGLHQATAACGSVVIALALCAGEIDAREAWARSQVDETFQIEEWGKDPEATKRQEGLLADIEAAAALMRLSGGE